MHRQYIYIRYHMSDCVLECNSFRTILYVGEDFYAEFSRRLYQQHPANYGGPMERFSKARLLLCTSLTSDTIQKDTSLLLLLLSYYLTILSLPTSFRSLLPTYSTHIPIKLSGHARQLGISFSCLSIISLHAAVQVVISYSRQPHTVTKMEEFPRITKPGIRPVKMPNGTTVPLSGLKRKTDEEHAGQPRFVRRDTSSGITDSMSAIFEPDNRPADGNNGSMAGKYKASTRLPAS